jgi:hypothetical protein
MPIYMKTPQLDTETCNLTCLYMQLDICVTIVKFKQLFRNCDVVRLTCAAAVLQYTEDLVWTIWR